MAKNKLVSIIVFLAVALLPITLFAELKVVEYQRNVYYDSDPQAGAPIDIDFHTPPTFMPNNPMIQNRFDISLATGINPYYLKGGVRVRFIWDTDSVIPGSSFTVKVIAETDSTFEGDPFIGGSHEIYSNYGLQAGITLEARTLTLSFGLPTWSSWVETPVGVGFDACLHLTGDGKLPMNNESLTAEDLINIIGIGADIFTGGKAVMNRHGEPVPKSTESTLLGFLNLISLGVNVHYKLQDGLINLTIQPMWPFSYDPAYGQLPTHTWMNRGDTVLLHLKVDPAASQSDTGALKITLAEVREDIYSKGAAHVDLPFYHADMYDNDWGPVGSGTVYLHTIQNFPDIILPVTGTTQTNYYADLYIDPHYLTLWHTRWVGSYVSHTPTPQVGGYTGVGIKVNNEGNVTSGGYTIKFVFPDSVIEEHRDGHIPPGGHDDVAKVSPEWLLPGQVPISVIIIPDSVNGDPNPQNDTLNFNVFVEKHRIITLIAVVNELNGDTITPADSAYQSILVSNTQTYSEWAVPDTTYNQWDRWLAFVPEDEHVNITAIPDSQHNELTQTTRYVEMDTVSSEPFWVYIRLIGKGAVSGTVTDENGEPAGQVVVGISTFYVDTTDENGNFLIDSLPANQGLSGSPYYLKFYKPGYRIDSIPVYVGNFDTLQVNHQLTNIDSIPPIGQLISDSIVKKTFTIRMTAMDTFTQFGNTVPPSRVMIKDGNSSWETFDYGNGFDFSVDWTLHTRTNHNEIDTVYAKFIDNAGNVSEPVSVTVMVDQDGPDAQFWINEGTSTSNPAITVMNTLQSTLVPVKSITIEESGVRSVTYNYIGNPGYAFTLDDIAGTHTLLVYLTDSLGVSSAPESMNIYLDYSGRVLINNDATYTDTPVVDLSIEANSIIASNASGNDNFSGHSVAQSFIPHSDRIYGVSVYESNHIENLKIGIYRDSAGLYGHIPTEMIGLDSLTTPTTPGWVSVTFSPPLTVNPDSSYMVVLYQYDLDTQSPDINVRVGPENNYSEGNMYYYSIYEKGAKTEEWYNSGSDMLFRVLGRAESMEISNYSDFHSSTGMIQFEGYYNGWQLLAGEGKRQVYVRIVGDQTSTISDEIVVDTTPPTDLQVSVLNHLPYLETTECTLSISAVDTLSGIAAYKINSLEWQDAGSQMPITLVYDVASGAPGPRTISVWFRDRAGNVSSPETLTVDYDPYGPEADLTLGNDGFASSETVSVHIELAKFNGKSIAVDSMKLSDDNRHWSEWLPFKADTTYIFSSYGIVGLWVRLKDNYGKVSTTSATCMIDITPPSTPYHVRDEGDWTRSHSHLTFWWLCRGDYQSGIDHYVIEVSTDPSFMSNVHAVTADAGDRSATIEVPNMHGDSTYYARVIAFNRAGLSSASEVTDGITVVNGIVHFELISPPDSSLLQSGQPIQLIWHSTQDTLSTLTGYEVFLDGQSMGMYSDTVFSIESTVDGWHSWQVVAHDEFGDTRITPEYHFFVGDVTPPPIPEAVFPSDTFLNSDTVNFVWRAGDQKTANVTKSADHSKNNIESKGTVTYLLQISADTSFSSYVDSIETSDTTVSVTLPEGVWYWRVRASNIAGSSEWTLPRRFAVDTTSPAQFTLIAPEDSETIYADTVQFNWHASSDSMGLRMYHFQCWSSDTNISFETTDTAFTAVLRTGTYLWSVSAVDSAGNTTSTSENLFFVEVITLPTPTLAFPLNDTALNEFDVTFIWHPGQRTELKASNGKDTLIRYILHVSSEPEFGDTVVADTIADTTASHMLQEGTFFWRVREIDEDMGLSMWSDTWHFLIDATPPSPPDLITPSDSDTIYSDTVHFAWHPSQDNYGVEYYNFHCLSSDTTIETRLTDTSCVLVLDRNGAYQWFVEAVDRAQLTASSPAAMFTIMVPNLPTPILLWPPNDSILNTTDVPFAWSNGNSEDGHHLTASKTTDYYLIQVASDSSFDSIVASDTVTDTTDTLTITPGFYAYWRVRRFDDEGNISRWTEPWITGVDVAAPTLPQLISPPTRDTIDTNSVTFYWHRSVDDFSGVAFYEFRYVWWRMEGDSGRLYIEFVTDTTITLSDLPQGHYMWYVRPHDYAGNAQSTDYRTFDINYIGPPDLLEPVAGEWRHGNILFRWRLTLFDTTISIPYDYEIQVITDSNIVVLDTIVSSTMFHYSLPDRQYRWRVRVGQWFGPSRWSTVDSFRVDNTPPSIPAIIEPQNGGNFTSFPLQFLWASSTDNLSGIVGYELLIADNPDMMFPVVDTLLQDTLFVLDTLVDGEWFCQVRCADSAGNIAYSNINSFTVESSPLPVPVLLEPVWSEWQGAEVMFRWGIEKEKRFMHDMQWSEKYEPEPGDSFAFVIEIMLNGDPVICDTVDTDSVVEVMEESGTYQWHVKTILGWRSSEWSPIDSFRVDVELPEPPALIYPHDESYVSSFPAEFIWSRGYDEVSGLAGYRVIVSEDYNLANPVVDTVVHDTTVLIGPLSDGEWFWDVASIDSAGNENMTDPPVCFWVDTTPPAAV